MARRSLLAATGLLGLLGIAAAAWMILPGSSPGDSGLVAAPPPSTGPAETPPPNPGYREGIGNIHADASDLALLLAHTAGDAAACGAVCSNIDQPAALQLWFEEVCNRLTIAVEFTVDGFAAEVTPAAHRLIAESTATCSGFASLVQSAGPPDPASAEWKAFAETHRGRLANALAAVETGTRG